MPRWFALVLIVLLGGSAAGQETGVRLYNAVSGAWEPMWAGDGAPGRIVVLVHGLDEPGDIWDDLAPALTGHTVARFEYPDDQRIGPSAELLAEWMGRMRSAGVAEIDLVCHSMGGLVAREALTRPGLVEPGRAPVVRRLVLIGTPNAGSPWASLEPVAELRQEVVRFADDPSHDWRHLKGLWREGRGGAAEDLTPGSAFLRELNARPWPTGVRVTALVGRVLPRGTTGEEQIGDGVVPVASARPEGFEDVVELAANHRGLIRYSSAERALRRMAGEAEPMPPGVSVVLDRLAGTKP